MATAPANALPQNNDPLAALTTLLGTIGGTKSTSNPGDITALQQLMAQLQGADYSQLLQGIFQQANAAVPALQNSYAGGTGSRTLGNQPLQAALQKLMMNTTLAGADQITKAQQANQQTQAQVGNSIAQATAGTQKTQSTNLAAAAQNLAMLQAISKLGQTEIGRKLTGDIFMPASAAPGTVPAMQSAPANFQVPTLQQPNYQLSGSFPSMDSVFQPYVQEAFTPNTDTIAPTPNDFFTPVQGDAYMPAYEELPLFG